MGSDPIYVGCAARSIIRIMPAARAEPRVRLTEVGPRDGLQNEKSLVSTADKIAFINALSLSGVSEIEVSSFVSARHIPQLGDAAEVFAGITRASDVVYSALVPNLKGLEGALACGVEKIAVFTAASETFNRHNINASIAESIDRFAPVVAQAKAQRIAVRAYISCAVACPYEGPIAPAAVADVARRLLDLGVDEIDLGDTIGVAAPTDIEALYEAASAVIEPARTTLHLHDTRGTALACLLRAVEIGVMSFDASSGGLGGCPFAPGASGNLATEDVVYCLERMGRGTGVDLSRLIAAGRIIERALGRALPGRVYRAETSCR